MVVAKAFEVSINAIAKDFGGLGVMSASRGIKNIHRITARNVNGTGWGRVGHRLEKRLCGAWPGNVEMWQYDIVIRPDRKPGEDVKLWE